jgi:hypothetical protein
VNDEPAPPPAFRPDWRAAGAAFAVLLMTRREWVHRRVEQIRFEDQTVARRFVSVDFTIPDVEAPMRSAAGPVQLVPLTRLRKRTLTNFDLVDESGGSLPMLARDQHKNLANAALAAVAGRALGADPEPAILDACEGVATNPPDDAAPYLRVLLNDPALAQAAYFTELAEVLAESFVVTVPLAAEPGRRRVLKFSYDELVGDPELRFRDTFRRGAAWRSKPVWFPAYAMNDVPSYHLEVEAPSGLWITRRELTTTDDAAENRQRRGPYQRARFYYQPGPKTRGVAEIKLRPQTSTLVRASAMVAAMAFALLMGVFAGIWFGGFEDLDTNTPALLLLLPGALAAVLLRADEHAMTTDMLYFIRLSTLAPGVLSFLGAAAFTALPHHAPALLYIFGALAWLAYFPMASLAFAWRLCTFPTDPDRARTRAAYTFP